MLSYKSWLETRWRFFIGLAVMLCSAAAIVIQYPTAMRLLQEVPAIRMEGEIGRRIQEALDLSRHYRGYVWLQGFQQNLAQMGTLFAILLGTGGLLSPSAGGGVLFTLSLPTTRRRLVAARAGTGLVQWLVLSIVSALVIPLLSPAVGESYGVGSALVHGFCLFAAGAVFFSLALLLSSVFGDVWRPLLIALAVAIVMAVPAQVKPEASRYMLSGVMSGEAFFRTGHLPWFGLLVSVVLSAALLYGTVLNFERRDF